MPVSDVTTKPEDLTIAVTADGPRILTPWHVPVGEPA